jgi:flagellar basal-body rod protein FlgG
MIKGIYTAASGMVSLLASNDNIANSLANVNTPGFKKGVTLFKSFAPMLIDKISAQGTKNTDRSMPLGAISPGSALSGIAIDFTQGRIEDTANKLDFAIEGDGFFEVQTDSGERLYTRNGRFKLDDEGFLTTLEGYRVIGMNDAPIKMGMDLTTLEVTNTGELILNKEPINQLKVVDFENKHGLVKRGNSCFEATNVAGNQIEPGYKIVQSAVEGSNANVISSMVNTIEGMRAYETLARVVENTSRSLEKTTTQLGRIQ